MISVNKPNISVDDTYLACISIVKNRDLRDRLTACRGLVIEAEKELERKIPIGDVHTITKEKTINNNVDAKELENVYTLRMVKKDTPGRVFYDKLISASPNGICPLCSHRVVETLDHYLPKADFPRLAVSPINLIPSCSDCNKAKTTSTPTKPEEQTLHPYFDNIENERWLFARVNHTIPPSISYFIQPIETWPELLGLRVKYHFSILALNRLFSIQAAVQLSNIEFRLSSIIRDAGKVGVKSYLKDEAESRFQTNKNSWQTAFYSALYEDDWYCDGGFRMK